MGVALFFIFVILGMAVWVAVFIAVLRAERVEGICQTVDDACGGFSGASAGDGEDGDVVLVFEAAVELGPFVIFGYFAE